MRYLSLQVSGAPRLLPSHRGKLGTQYLSIYRGLVREYGPAPRHSARALLIGLAARAYVLSDMATQAYLVAYEQREVGTGRRPSAKLVASLEARQGLAMDRWTRALYSVQVAAGTIAAKPVETRQQRQQRELAEDKARHRAMLAGIPSRPTSPQGGPSPAQQPAEGAEVLTSPQDGNPRG